MPSSKTPLVLLVLCPLLALPAPGLAAPTEVDLDAVGRRWLGEQYLDNFGWFSQAPGDLNGDGLSDFAVSSPQDEGPLTFDSSIRVFLGRSDGLPQSGLASWADIQITDGKVGGDAVFQFAFIPDATGDGVQDLLVVEPNASTAGKVLLYAGSSGDWPEELNSNDAIARWDGYLQDESSQLAPETRPSLVAGGDLDGDGIGDVVVVSGLFNRAWIDWGGDGFADEASLETLEDSLSECTDEVPAAQFGSAMVVGNFNGDSQADLAISAPGCVDDEGRVYVWYGSPTGLASDPDLTLDGGDRLGGALNVLDVNEDGIDDLLVQELLSSADGEPNRESRGNLWILLGSSDGLPATPDVRIDGGVVDRRFGEAVAMLPDTSDPPDGLGELVVGSPESTLSTEGQGSIYIFAGRDWSTVSELGASDALYRVDGSHRDAWFGASLSTLDDFDGDGYPELVIGEPNYTEGESENDFRRGRIYLFSALPDRDEDGDGISTLNGDCDDTDEAVSPLSFEDCADDIDNDCDHEVNEGCDDGDDDDDTVDPGDDDDDDEEEGCSCESSLAGASPARAAGAAVLGGLWLGLAVYRRRIE